MIVKLSWVACHQEFRYINWLFGNRISNNLTLSITLKYCLTLIRIKTDHVIVIHPRFKVYSNVSEYFVRMLSSSIIHHPAAFDSDISSCFFDALRICLHPAPFEKPSILDSALVEIKGFLQSLELSLVGVGNSATVNACTTAHFLELTLKFLFSVSVALTINFFAHRSTC
jgi:hypothetical protein